MRRVHSHVVLLLLYACALPVAGGPDEAYKLVGGREATPELFPATVAIPGCTAVKVAERAFLTAGHCVLDEQRATLKPGFAPGDHLFIEHGASDLRGYTLQVRRTLVYPLYVDSLMDARANDSAWDLAQCHAESGDLALIEVRESTASIGTAGLDSSPLVQGDAIFVGGYGCEWDPLSDPNAGMVTVVGQGGRVLNYAPTTISHLDTGTAAFDNGSWVSNLKLCPGDSGGPVYRVDRSLEVGAESTGRIVAVNACAGPLRSVLTRLDRSEPLRIGACVKEALSRPANRPAPIRAGFSVLCDAR